MKYLYKTMLKIPQVPKYVDCLSADSYLWS